jgi:hypothetical protein
MEEKRLIWEYLSMKKGTYDNDYYFYEDGTIVHHFDCTINKWDKEEHVLASDISETEKGRILAQCNEECPLEIYNQIKAILMYE